LELLQLGFATQPKNNLDGVLRCSQTQQKPSTICAEIPAGFQLTPTLVEPRITIFILHASST
jgi:hypothetical protein